MALVLQHDFQSTPARIQRAFGRGSLQHPLTTDIAYKNGPVLGYHRVAEFMQGILALIGNLGMDGTNAIFLFGPLRTGKRLFLSTIPMALQFLAVGRGGGSFHPQIHAHAARSGRRNGRNLNHDIEIPASTNVLVKIARTKLVVG